MNDATLSAFRDIAAAMNPEPHDWEFSGPYISQQYVGITEKRAKDLQAKYGGTARKMASAKS